MKKIRMTILAVICTLGMLALVGCGDGAENPREPSAEVIYEESSDRGNDSLQAASGTDMEKAAETDSEKRVEKEEVEMKMNVQIGEYSFTAALENNAAAGELVDMMKEGPVTIQMDDYSGFEKVGPLGRSLTTSNSQTTTSAGDIVLYSGDNIVMFYGSNSWSYTRIGKIEDLADWEKALRSGSITAVFTLAE